MTNATEPSERSGPPLAPGVYQPDQQGPLPRLTHLRLIHTAVSIAVLALFFTGFVSPGFFHGGSQVSATPISNTDLDPGADPALDPDIQDPYSGAGINPAVKAEIDKFVDELNLGDVQGATAMLCTPTSAHPGDIQQAVTNSHQWRVDMYNDTGVGDAATAMLEGEMPSTNGDEANANMQASSAPGGGDCVSQMIVTS
jgi:hypothetical protein